MNKVAAFALRRKNSILSMSEKMFCPPQPLRFWITPACAGKRRSDWIIRSIYWDHPRMCGEKLGKISAPNIGQGDDLRADGDVIAFEAVRVAPAIPALMVPAGDVVGGLQQGLILKVFQPPQHVGTLHTVGLDDLELLFTRNRFRLLCNNFLRGGVKWAKDCNKIKNLV